jgi:hypothetical protein
MSLADILPPEEGGKRDYFPIYIPDSDHTNTNEGY